MRSRKWSPAAQRFAERRQREDDAPRLSAQVPRLIRLEIEFEERSGSGRYEHIRRIVIDRAPALFLVVCGDERCTDGEHDLTSVIMRALHAREKSFRGSDECRGSLGPSACARVLHYDGSAEYRGPAEA
jgi:hypothetical protein